LHAHLVANPRQPCKASLAAEPGIVPTSPEHGTAQVIRNADAPRKPELSPLFIPHVDGSCLSQMHGMRLCHLTAFR
jgi:hypothetical protein